MRALTRWPHHGTENGAKRDKDFDAAYDQIKHSIATFGYLYWNDLEKILIICDWLEEHGYSADAIRYYIDTYSEERP